MLQDHFNGDFSNPGEFELNYSIDGGVTFYPGASLSDDATPTLGLYTLSVSSGAEFTPGPIIIQAVYKTNNPSAPPAFYQCADGIALA